MSNTPATQEKPPRIQFTSRPKESDREYRTPAHAWDRVRSSSSCSGRSCCSSWRTCPRTGPRSGSRSRNRSRATPGSSCWRPSRCSGSCTTTSRSSRRPTTGGGGTRWIEEAVLSKINPNVRYRLGRLLRFLFFAWVFGAIIASFISEPGNEVGAIEAWFRLPGIIKEQLGASSTSRSSSRSASCSSSRSSGSCPAAAPRCTCRTTSTRGSPTSRVRTPCSIG